MLGTLLHLQFGVHHFFVVSEHIYFERVGVNFPNFLTYDYAHNGIVYGALLKITVDYIGLVVIRGESKVKYELICDVLITNEMHNFYD